MKLYLDLFFLLNVTMDFFLLCTVGRVLHLPTKVVPLLLSSVFGGVYACAALLLPRYAAFGSALLFAPILIRTAFGKNVSANRRLFSKAVFLLFGASFLTGGLCCLILSYVPQKVSPLVFFPICGGIFFFAFRYFDLLALSEALRPVTVTFRHKGKKESLRLLCDSGCLVREPISSLPVLMISPKKFDSLFPDSDLHNTETALRYRLRCVPIQNVSGSGVIPAVMPSELTCQKENEPPAAFSALLGRALTDAFSGYDGIFPSSLL